MHENQNYAIGICSRVSLKITSLLNQKQLNPHRCSIIRKSLRPGIIWWPCCWWGWGSPLLVRLLFKILIQRKIVKHSFTPADIHVEFDSKYVMNTANKIKHYEIVLSQTRKIYCPVFQRSLCHNTIRLILKMFLFQIDRKLKNHQKKSAENRQISNNKPK